MGEISPYFESKVMTKRTRSSLGWARSPHRLADRADRVRAFPSHRHYRSRGNIRNQSIIKWFALMNGVVRISKFSADLHELGGNQAKSATLKTGDHLSNQRALDTIWLD